MSVDSNSFQNKFEAAIDLVESLVLRSGRELDSSELVAEALRLSVALEELQVISEELYEQNEKLLLANRSLEAERRRNRELFECSPDGYLVTDIKGIIRDANNHAARTFNYPAQFLLGKPLAILISSTQRQQFYSLLNQLQQHPETTHAELILQPRENPPFSAAITISALRDDGGCISGLYWLFRDLTETHLIKAALEQSEARYRAIVEEQTDLVCQFSREGQISFANPAFCRLFDICEEDAIGRTFISYVCEADRLSVQRQLHTCSRTHPTTAFECRSPRHNRKNRWIQWDVRSIFDKEGRLARFQSVGRDITARKIVEDALQQSEEKLRLTTNALPALIAYIDPQEHFQFVNQTYEEWFARPCDRVVGGGALEEMLGQTIYNEIQEPLRSAFSGEKKTFEGEWLCGDGQIRDISATFVPHIDGSGAVIGLFSLIIDISDRKAIEHMKEEFLSVVSHELRTPLTSIHGSLKLLATGRLGELSPDGEDMIHIADENCDRLVGLINDLLDFRRLKSGKIVLYRQAWTAGGAIQKAATIMQGMADRHNIFIETAPASVPIWAEPDLVIQVITNLISNAIKFSPEGSTIRIDAQPRGNEVLFSVRDRGKGIPANLLESIFDYFQQIDDPMTRQKGGTGLGLAICRNVVELHGGKIWAESVLNRGSTFFFTLPQEREHHAPQTHFDD